MTTTTEAPVTARAVLFGTDDAAAAVARSLHDRGYAGSLGHAAVSGAGATGRAVEDEIARVADGLLSLDVVDLLAAGWRKHSALAAAGRRTAAAPGTEEVVELVTHRVTSVHRPYVELYVDGTHVATVNLELRVGFVVAGLLGVVRDGSLVALRSGRLDVTAVLDVEGIEVARGSRTLDLAVDVPLGSGISLAGAELPKPRPAAPAT